MKSLPDNQGGRGRESEEPPPKAFLFLLVRSSLLYAVAPEETAR